MRIFASILFVLILCSKGFCCDSTKVIAHRGVSSLAPENTLPAFQLGIDLGVDFIELDVQRSLDDSLMVIHDPTVDGTTGSSGLVSSYTYNQLKTMDAGSWFSANYSGTEIPTLFESLNLLRNKAKICVELKASNIEVQAIELIENMGLVEDVVIESFSYSQLQTVRQLNPNIRICYLASFLTQNVINDANAIDAEIIGAGNDPDIWLINNAQNLGIEVWNYTINSGNTMVHRISKGLDGLFTDNPQDMIGIKSYMMNGGLIAHWNFDENSGQSISDLSPHENNLTMDNASWTNGIINSAVDFNGSSQNISVPLTNSLNIISDQVSIATWIRLNQLPSNISGAFGPIYDSDEDSYILYLDKSNQELRFKITDNSGLTARPGIPENLLSLGEWMHVACVYNGKEAIIYLNGEIIDVVTTTAIGNIKPNQQASFGSNNGNFFDGSIDEFKIYQRPLSPFEIRQMYFQESTSCENNEPALISYESFGFPLLNDSIDCPGYGISNTYFIPNYIMDFDGINYININSTVDELKNNSHSFFCWIRTSNPTNDERVFSINDRYGDNKFLFGIYNGKINIYNNGSYFSGINDLNDNEWHFIGYTWNKDSQQMKFFVDGNIELAYTLDLSIESTDRVSIGQEFDDYQCSNYYHGFLSEISIWNVEVNLSQSLELMNSAPSLSAELIGFYNNPIQCGNICPDGSQFNNTGYSCRKVNYLFDTLPNYHSNAIVNWENVENNEILSGSNILETNIDSNSIIVYNVQYDCVHISDTIIMQAFELPIINNFDDTSICTNQNLIIDPGEFSTYEWSNGNSTQTQNVFSDTPSEINLSVLVTNEYGCEAVDTIIISIDDCLNVEELSTIFVFPNPISDEIFHIMQSDELKFDLFDNQGKKIPFNRIHSNSFQTKFQGVAFLVLENEPYKVFKLIFH